MNYYWNHFTVCKQTINISEKYTDDWCKIKLLASHDNIWNDFANNEQMINTI